MTHALIRVAAVAGAIALTPGCFWVTTKHEGEKMRTDLDQLEERVAEQEKTLGSRVAELQKVLDEATDLLARNSADLGAEVNGLVEEQARLNGLVMEAQRGSAEVKNELSILQKQFEDLEQRLVLLEQRVSEEELNDPQEIYKRAKQAFSSKQYEEANKMFRYLVVKFPDHERADEAQYHRGEARYRQENFESALGEFQRVFENYPDSPIADDALYRAGETALELKWCTDARAYFQLLRKRYPKSSLASKAGRKGRQIRKYKDNASKCAS